MKNYIFDQYVEEFEKAEKYFNQLKSTEKWLRYSFKIMSKYKEDYKKK